MRAPTPPPKAEEMPSRETVETFVRLAGEGSLLRRSTEAYWSWDDLRRHPLPQGLDAASVWQALHVHRASRARWVPLHDVAGQPFRYVLTDELIQQLLRLQASAVDEFGLRRADGTALPFERDVQRSSIIEEAIHSSLIEGAVSTRQIAREMLERGRPPRTHSERMIANNFQTIEMLQEVAAESLSTDLVREIHRSMTHGTLDRPEDAGRIQRPGEERICVTDEDGDVLFRPPPAAELPERLERLCAFANDDEDGVPDTVKAVLLHFQLAHDHPFVDGNGRTARALFYWFMLRKRHALVRYLSISRIILESKARYARSYLHVEQTGDLTYFLRYHFDVHLRALEALGAYLRGRRTEVGDAERALSRWPSLNLRQKLLVRDALVHPERWYTAGGHAGAHGVTHQTAITDLRSLVACGLLVASKRGRENVFRPSDDLVGRLARPLAP